MRVCVCDKVGEVRGVDVPHSVESFTSVYVSRPECYCGEHGPTGAACGSGSPFQKKPKPLPTMQQGSFLSFLYWLGVATVFSYREGDTQTHAHKAVRLK